MDTRSHASPASSAVPSFRETQSWLWWLAVAGWMGLIFLLSAQPEFAFVPDAWQGDPLSLSAHALEYAVLAVLLWTASRHTPFLAFHAGLATLFIALLYAASDEWHQAFVPGRVPDVWDWLADTAGALVALWLASRLHARRRQAADRQATG